MANLGFPFDPATVERPCGFADLPDIPAIQRLKSRRQWVSWKYVQRGDANSKPTKPLYQPASGMPASHSNPEHWGTYDAAVARSVRGRMAGVGYVLSADDDLTGYDLDNCRDPDTGDIDPWAQAIVDLAETYCEVSPSETGLRLIAEGKVEAAIKRDPASVEVYGVSRYLTITGWHVPGTPTEIRPAPKTLAALKARVAEFDAAIAAERAGAQPVIGIPISEQHQVLEVRVPQAAADSGSPFFRNVNSAALASLHSWVPSIFGAAARFQPSTGAFRVSSKALGRTLQEDLSIAPTGIRDWGVGDMGDARHGARTPIDLVISFGFEREAKDAAFWLCNRLGKDPASLGYVDRDAVGAEVATSLLARRVIEAPDGTRADAETGEIIEAPDAELGELPASLARPPGLLGEVADWICDTARRPQRSLAIGAALSIIGTLAGRHIAGPTGSGTHLYIVGLAPTGAGKDHAMQQILTAMTGAEAAHFIGPGQFISMPAVINFLVRAPLSICAMDEFGSFLKRINSRKASSFEGAISGIMRTAWGSSFKPMPTPEWAGKASQVIMSPAMSIYGVSTADEFYGAMEGGDSTNGVLNRLLVIETRKRPKDRPPRLESHALTPALADGLKAVVNRGGPLVFSQLQQFDRPPPVHRVPWGAGAEEAFANMVEEIHRICDGDVMAQAFFARAAETAVRIATILAIGINPDRPVLTLDAFTWAREFSMWCARSLQRGGTEHIADSDNQSAANAVRRAVREAGGRMKHRDLLRRLNHRIKNRDLIDIVKALVEAEQISVEKVVPEGGGTPSVWYNIG